MTVLRTRFVQDMQLHGFSPKTQSCYVGAVRSLAKFLSRDDPNAFPLRPRPQQKT